MKRRILFVDDEPNVLQGLRRMLHAMRDEWEMGFAESGEEALEMMEEAAYDVVVSDMRMPGIDGAGLLDEVMKRHPNTVRLVLSGQSDRQGILRSIGRAHQYLSKPCDATTLKSTIARACALRDLLASEELTQLVAGMKTLPSLPSLYIEVMRELHSPTASIRKLGETIAKDVGMAAKTLQLINSAFFGLRYEITDPVEAAVYLGLDTMRALVFSARVFSQFSGWTTAGFSIKSLWDHSMAVGGCAKMIAQAEAVDRKLVDECLMAGILHDVGKLVFATNLPEDYGKVISVMNEREIGLCEAEHQVFSASHAEVGAYLMGLWGLPDPIVEALAFHHNPSKCPCQAFSPLTAVHVANAFVHDGSTLGIDAMTQLVDMDFLSRLGLEERLSQWYELYVKAGKEKETVND